MAKELVARPPDESPMLQGDDSLSTAITLWESTLRGSGSARNTVAAFTADLRLLLHYLGGGRALADISTQDINDFLRWMETERGVACSPKTYSRRITSVKAFFRFAREAGAYVEDPAAPVIQRPVQSPLPEILTGSEMDRALAAARALRTTADPADPDDRPFVLLSLLLQTGIKKGECIALRRNHVETTGPDPYLVVRYGNPRQRFKERKLGLSAEWVDAYAAYLRKYDPEDRVFPWSPRRLEYLLEDIGRKAGFSKHLSFDMCRWTCAVMDRRSGIDGDVVREKLGLSRMQWREVGAKLERLLLPGAAA
jgi:site-specific recombinase XerD